MNKPCKKKYKTCIEIVIYECNHIGTSYWRLHREKFFILFVSVSYQDGKTRDIVILDPRQIHTDFHKYNIYYTNEFLMSRKHTQKNFNVCLH